VRATQALQVYERAMRRRGLSPETVVVNLGAVRRFLAHVRRPPRRLRRQDVASYLADLQRAEVAPATQARVLAVLRRFAHALFEAGALARDPTERLVVDKGRPAQHAAPSVAAVARLLAAADQRPRSGASPALALRDRALLELLYGLGLRSSEARAALVVDLDLAEGSLLVRAAKRGHSRTLPLPRATLPHLRRYLEEGRPRLVRGEDTGHLIVSKTGRPLRHARDVGLVVEKVARRVDLRLHPHALRRALATHLVLAGVNVRAVQVLLRHQSLAVTARYLAVDRAGLHRTVALLERRRPGDPATLPR
jgi:site-specific recombinase XerD